jgi:hypothetical protein
MSALIEPPNELICPITLELMKEPYLCPEDGYTYEKNAIMAIKDNLSPITRIPINKANLILNRALNDAILRFTKSNDIMPHFTKSNIVKQQLKNTTQNVISLHDIDQLLKIEIKYIDFKIKTVQATHSTLHNRSYERSFDAQIIKINSRLSELKNILLNFINANKILEQELNSINNNKNDQVSNNWRENMLNEHNNKLIKEQQLQKIQNKINLIKKKITETHQCIASYEREKKIKEKCIKEKKESDELIPIITMFNFQMPDLHLLFPYTHMYDDCNRQVVKHNHLLPSQKFKINLQMALLIKNSQQNQILFHYNSLKKCLSDTFEPYSVEIIWNNFANIYNIKNLIPSGYCSQSSQHNMYIFGNQYSNGIITCESNPDIIFLNFNYIKIYSNKQNYENIKKLLNIFLDLIIFLRPDIEEQVNHKDFQKEQEEKARR